MSRAALACLLATTACSHQQDISTIAIGTRVTVETVDGRDVDATVAPDPQHVRFRAENGELIDASDIRRVVARRRWRGALEGFGIGYLIGGGIGSIAGYSDGDDRCEELCILAFSAEEKAAFASVAFGTVTGLAGAVVGLAVGSRNVYTFGHQEEYRVTLQSPAGSVAGATLQW